MKKFIISAILLIGATFALSAQPRAIGVRLGNGFEASYQHTLGKDFVEVDLGLADFVSLAVNATAVYDFMISQPKWTNKGEWGFYAGPGFSMGYACRAGFNFGFVGQVGLEYKFDFPLQLSIDYRPIIDFCFPGGFAYNPYTLIAFNASVRYCF